MRALWTQFGRPGQKTPGKVSTPYTIDGLKESLAKVAGDRGFANDFFSKYVEGRELVDYGKLLGRAGLVLRKRSPGKAFAGQVSLQPGGSALRVNGLVPWESPLYKAGVAQDDQLVNLGGVDLTSMAAFEEALAKQKARRCRAAALRAPQRRNREQQHHARRRPSHRDCHSRVDRG